MTALPQPMVAGDVVWLRGGTCYGGMKLRMVGTAGAHITIRVYPGEKVCFDGASSGAGGTLIDFDSTAQYVDLTGPLTGYTSTPVRSAASAQTPAGCPNLLSMMAHDSTAALLTLRDACGGIAIWSPAHDSTVAGAYIWGQGWSEPGVRWHAHSIYWQHDDAGSWSRFHSSIMLPSGSTTWRLGGTDARPAYVNFDVRDVLTYTGDDQFDGPTPRDNYDFDRCHWWNLEGAGDYLIMINEVDYSGGDRLSITNSTFFGFRPYIGYFNRQTFTGNTINSPGTVDIYSLARFLPNGGITGTFVSADINGNRWLRNAALGNPIFGYVDAGTYVNYTLAQARAAGFETTGSEVLRSSLSTEVLYDTRLDAYDVKRCHVVVYNWQSLNTVNLDLSQCGFSIGDHYEIWDLFALGDATALHSGTYSGGTVEVNASYAGITQPTGVGAMTYVKPGIQRRAYLVLRPWAPTATSVSVRGGAGAATLEVRLGHYNAAGTVVYDTPLASVACTAGAVCTISVPQRRGEARYLLTQKDAGGAAVWQSSQTMRAVAP